MEKQRLTTVSHVQFMTTFTNEMRGNYTANQAQEVLLLGCIELFWAHSKNIAYLNQAMQYARGRRGIRVNAVKAFILRFTGAKMKGKDFVGGGKMKQLPNLYFFMDSWTDWANKNAAEPEYNHKAMVLKLETFLGKSVKDAQKGGDTATAEMLRGMLDQAVAAR